MTEQTYVRRTYEPLKFLGRLFWVPFRVLPDTPFLSLNHTWESNGEHWGPTIVLRLPFRWGLGLGVWLDAPKGKIVEIHEEEAEYDRYVAVNGAVPKELWSQARKKISEMGMDPDEEMELMQAMEVFE